jgi:hypothetical protein
MAKAAEKIEELTLPEGGIAGFVMSDEDFSVLEDQEAKKEFGKEGLAQFTAVARNMAGYGRFGDDSVAHLQTGEIIVPLALIENNPDLKEQIFKNLRDNGIEDPEQYVVGNKANSINPQTGLMEFGFFKSLFRGIKSVLKAVVKVVKVVAPIVLPIVLSMTPLGPVFGAALGSGIATLINGGNIKDALKAGLISGAMGGVMAGFSGPGSFGENVTGAFANPVGRVAQTGAALKAGFNSGSLSGFGSNVFTGYAPPGAPTGPNALPPVGDAATGLTPVGDAATAATPTVGDAATNAYNTDYAGWLRGEKPFAPPADTAFPTAVTGPRTPAGTGPIAVERNLWQTAGDWMFRGGYSPDQLTEAGKAAGTAMSQALEAGQYGAALTPESSEGMAMIAKAVANAETPGMLATYGPSVALATTGAVASGMFDTPEIEKNPDIDYGPDGKPITGEDLIEADPGKYLMKDLGGLALNEETGEYEDKPFSLPLEPPVDYSAPAAYRNPFERPYVTESQRSGISALSPYVSAARGGPIFSRRTGGISPSEGRPNKDSVRAMLMPGEFVMTKDAVSGMGNGNLNKGIKNMYSVMRNLESRGRSVA